MWKIVHIFDGEYGCEESTTGAKPRVSVTIENEAGERRYELVEDEWLIENQLDVGDSWPK